MGDRIVFRTGSRDNGEAIGVLARDLDGGHLVLPSDHAVEMGTWVAFEVLLGDGQSFMEGMGRCVRSERAMNGHRVQLDDLQLDIAGEMLFERVVMARDDLEHGGRQTGEIDIARLAEATSVVEAPKPPPLPKPPSAVPPRPVAAARPPSAVPAPIRPPSALPARPAAPVFARHAASLGQAPSAASSASVASVSAVSPATQTPSVAKPPTRPPSIAPRAHRPSVVPTSPGGFPAVRPEAIARLDARPASVRPPSEVRPGSVRPPAAMGARPAPARSGLPPAPRVPTFAPLPFVPEDTRVDLAPSDTSVSPLRESRRPSAIEAHLQRLLPRLVAEGRVRDVEELRALALRLGLEALEIVYPD